MYDLIIIGGGPAGMTAAVYAARKKINTLLISYDIGGQGLTSWLVENYMGYQFIGGRELMQKFEEQLNQFPTSVKVEEGKMVEKLSKVDGGFEVKTHDGETYQARAIVLATGKSPRKLGVPGENELLGRGVTYCAICDGPVFADLNVAVIGGGNSAIDAARVAVRKGAKEVHIVYRREKVDMPAEEEEIAAAEEEGVKLHVLAAPVKVTGKSGKVAAIECARMALGELDRSGRRSPKPIQGSEFTLEVDMLIEAIGQRPDTASMNLGGAKTGKGGTLVADKRTLATEQKGVFVGGDAFTGPWTVIEAIASGQRAASSIKRFLSGKELGPRVDRKDPETIEYNHIAPTDEETSPHPRVAMKEIPLAERKSTFKEAVVNFTAKEAKEECTRCLRCDIG